MLASQIDGHTMSAALNVATAEPWPVSPEPFHFVNKLVPFHSAKVIVFIIIIITITIIIIMIIIRP